MGKHCIQNIRFRKQHQKTHNWGKLHITLFLSEQTVSQTAYIKRENMYTNMQVFVVSYSYFLGGEIIPDVEMGKYFSITES